MAISTALRPFENWRNILEEATGWTMTEEREFCPDVCQTFVSWQLFDPSGDPYGLPFEDWQDLTDFLMQNKSVMQALKKDFQAFQMQA